MIPPAPPLLQQTPFQRYWLGTTASGLATWGLTFTLGIAVAQADLSAGALGFALAARGLGFLAGVLTGGTMADRSGPRPVIFWAGLLATGAVAVLAFALASGQLWLLYLAAMLSGVGQGACRPAYQALLPAVVAADLRQQANAAASLSLNLSILAGPAVATALALWVGVAPTLALFAAFWLTSALSPPWPSKPDPKPRRSLMVEYREGFEEAARLGWFFPGLAALSVVIALGYSATNVLLPLVAQEGGAGLMVRCLTGYTLGGLVVAYFLGRSKSLPFSYALFGLGAYGLGPLGLLAPGLWLPALAYTLAGAGIQLFNILWFTHMQRDVAPDKLARVSSIDFISSFGVAPLGLALMAPLSGALGLATTLVLCGASCMVAAAVAWRFARHTVHS